jgi:hypothetical protein
MPSAKCSLIVLKELGGGAAVGERRTFGSYRKFGICPQRGRYACLACARRVADAGQPSAKTFFVDAAGGVPQIRQVEPRANRVVLDNRAVRAQLADAADDDRLAQAIGASGNYASLPSGALPPWRRRAHVPDPAPLETALRSLASD